MQSLMDDPCVPCMYSGTLGFFFQLRVCGPWSLSSILYVVICIVLFYLNLHYVCFVCFICLVLYLWMFLCVGLGCFFIPFFVLCVVLLVFVCLGFFSVFFTSLSFLLWMCGLLGWFFRSLEKWCSFAMALPLFTQMCCGEGWWANTCCASPPVFSCPYRKFGCRVLSSALPVLDIYGSDWSSTCLDTYLPAYHRCHKVKWRARGGALLRCPSFCPLYIRRWHVWQWGGCRGTLLDQLMSYFSIPCKHRHFFFLFSSFRDDP